MNKGKLLYGVGVNDSDYTLTKYVTTQRKPRKQRRVWVCPFYETWKCMLKRCYCEKTLKKNPAYKDCSVHPEWLIFSNFKSWMEKQDWEGNELDKDLKSDNFKGDFYSPETCVFIPKNINTFYLDCAAKRGDYKVGVIWNKRDSVFEAQCQNPFNKKRGYIGRFSTEEAAHKAWIDKKKEYAKILAESIEDSFIKEKFLNKLKLIEEK